MDNLIAVWGNSGAGKSLVSCAVANALTKKGDNVIVLCTDKLTPMFQVYLPMEIVLPEQSLGRLLSGEISEERLRHTIHIHPKNDHLGFMALTSGENGLQYQVNWSTDNIYKLVAFLFEKGFAEYIIFDCTSDVLSDGGTLFALGQAQCVLELFSPDTRSVSFSQSQMSILQGGNFNLKHIKIINNAYEYSPAVQMQKDYDIEFLLPHSRDVYGKFVGGGLIKDFSDEAGKKFEKVVEEILKRIVKANG
ncbi:MAG: hypothetical protein RR251_05110 [Hydrogenoanaerobacterium sp.]